MSYTVGVDFDNTLVSYNGVFWKTAKRLGFIAGGAAINKKSIRDLIRRLPDGEIKWQEVQAYVYGRAMGQAVLMDGVEEFFGFCRNADVRIHIVSHKMQFAAQDKERIDLQQAALKWMRENNFFNSKGFGLSAGQVFFESTREEKIRRIKTLSCSCFIDDLEEIFLAPSFPAGVQQCLFDPLGKIPPRANIKVFRNWREITRYFVTQIGKTAVKVLN